MAVVDGPVAELLLLGQQRPVEELLQPVILPVARLQRATRLRSREERVEAAQAVAVVEGPRVPRSRLISKP